MGYQEGRLLSHLNSSRSASLVQIPVTALILKVDVDLKLFLFHIYDHQHIQVLKGLFATQNHPSCHEIGAQKMESAMRV